MFNSLLLTRTGTHSRLLIRETRITHQKGVGVHTRSVYIQLVLCRRPNSRGRGREMEDHETGRLRSVKPKDLWVKVEVTPSGDSRRTQPRKEHDVRPWKESVIRPC